MPIIEPNQFALTNHLLRAFIVVFEHAPQRGESPAGQITTPGVRRAVWRVARRGTSKGITSFRGAVQRANKQNLAIADHGVVGDRMRRAYVVI